MHAEVEKHGGEIRKSYYAPGVASPENQLRKPRPGMALLAQRQHKMIDFTRSVMVGDSDSDIIFGQNLGMKTVRVMTVEPIKTTADLKVNSLEEFLKMIQK
jgi:HAD superfamily hydrolase (TIGR01662 family)